MEASHQNERVRNGSIKAANGHVNGAYEPDTEIPKACLASPRAFSLTIGSNGLPTKLSINGDNVSLYDINANRIIESRKSITSLFKQKNLAAKLSIHESTYDPEAVIYEAQTAFAVFRQMLIPFLIAGFGSVFAGIVLSKVQEWPVFKALPQFEIMVSAFLGLVGNIETTLASRLSTHANLGTLDRVSSLKEILMGNLFLVECQASTLGFFASIMALLMSTMKPDTRERITLDNVLLLCSSSMVTSMIANTLLAFLISVVIFLSRKFRVNPDNISTPVAASMGDVCTIAILACVANQLYVLGNRWVYLAIIVTLLSAALPLGYMARQNRYTHSVILTGWTAILGAVIIEQPGGVVMQSALGKFKVIATFQPLVNGIGSNLVGIQTSRMSTFLHATVPKGQLPIGQKACVSPIQVFLSGDTHSRMARLLLYVIVPAHLFYFSIIYALKYVFDFSVEATAAFLLCYCAAILIQLIILLYLAHVSVFAAWKRRINPDNSAIPFTSALADVLGNCLMAMVFVFLASINDKNALITDDSDPPALNATLSTLASIANVTLTSLLPTTN